MKNLKNPVLFLFCIALLPLAVLSNCASLPRNEETIIIPFTLENEWMVIYAEVNGTPGRYIWDSGFFDVHTFAKLENLVQLPKHRNNTSSKRYYIENGIAVNGQVIQSKSIVNYIPSHIHPQWEMFFMIKS